ncbi:hypothetical protein ADK67_21275 [Saccharothrix sp. NRRL B-16348]|uniref:PPE domain-containing protein n=1 Tax=Saccharothrix sp. NRRL B-16348 TaxID=1415542 RepID=UPI0006AE8B50|nr:PPE domain-containing protein [Saccharothrix sp. NRRL B-16348]KOX23181.1 hypothetical protein ADK67_21275 [Saccharothrix sp. NRRL B-16348]
MKSVTNKSDANTAYQIADSWEEIGETLRGLARSFSAIITGSRDGWTGGAAEGARSALLKVGQFSELASDQFSRTGEVVRDQIQAADEAKAKMPPVVEFDEERMYSDAARSGNLLDIMAAAFTVPALKAKAVAAHADAVRVMYARDDALYFAALGMPALAEPPKVTQEQGVITTPPDNPSVNTHTVDPAGRIGGGTSGTVGSTGTAGVTGTLPASLPVGDGGTTRTSWTTPPTVTPTPPPPPPTLTPPTYGQRPVAPPVGQPGWRPPVAPVGPPSGTTRVPPGGRSTGGSGTGHVGRPGFPGGMPGMPAAAGGGGAAGGAGGQGRAVGFGPTGGASFGPTGSQGDAARRAPGMGAMGAAAPMAGQGAPGGEDQEHQTKYLIPTDEYFDDKRMVAPETIGE